MQPQKKQGQQSITETSLPETSELSEAWRTLLGLQSSKSQKDRPEVDTTIQVQPLPGDPWNRLSHSKGMEPVDLQKTHLHNPHLVEDDEEVEHALSIMREATGQLPSLDTK